MGTTESELDFTDEIETWLQGLGARSPLGWANFVRVRGHELCSLSLAEKLFSVTADAVVLNFSDLDLTFWIDKEGSAISEAFFFDVHAERTAQVAGRISKHRVFDLLDGFRSIVPGFVRELCIGA